jgi:hypothetical protein
MQVATGGMPALIERSTEKWQYWQSIWKSRACRSWGKAIGWEAGAASSGVAPALSDPGTWASVV